MSNLHSNPSGSRVNKEEAIKNLGGMKWLYEKHVSLFLNKYSGSAIQLDQLLRSGRTDEARLLIHSIKGMAGTLGFNDLYISASRLETAIILASPRLQDLLKLYESHMKNTASDCKND